MKKARRVHSRDNGIRRPGRAGGVSPPIRGRLLWKLPLSPGGIFVKVLFICSVGLARVCWDPVRLVTVVIVDD